MATLSSPGIGSGLDINGIVTQLMAVEKLPLTQLSSQQSSYKTQLTMIGQIQSMLAGFQSAAKALTTTSASPSYLASSGDASVFTASVSSTAVAGNYAIGITQLAQSHKVVAEGVTDPDAAIGAGGATTLTIDFGTISGGSLNGGIYSGASFAVNAAKPALQVTIDSSNNTLTGIRDAINAANAGVRASIVNDGGTTPYRLVLTSTDTGAAGSLRIGVAGEPALQILLAYDPAGTQNLSQLQAAQNALLSVDGIAITKSGNTVTDAVQGVTLNLVQANSPGTAQLVVQKDSSALIKAVNALVASYNNVNQVIVSATAQKAALQGDSTTLGIQRQLRTALGDSIVTGGAYKSLAALHIMLQKDGTLAVDTTKLQDILNTNPADAAALIHAVSTTLGTLADNILAPGTGQIANETAGINAAIKNNTARQEEFQLRLASVEARYRAQFSALDAMMVSMSQTSNFLQQQFYKTTSSNTGG